MNRKPCFECDSEEQDDMSIGECMESALCTSTDPISTCSHLHRGGHWEDCSCGAKDKDYPAWLQKQSTVKCPCCKGSGSIPREGSIIDDIRALEWIGYSAFVGRCPVCAKFKMEGHADDCPPRRHHAEAQMIDIDEFEKCALQFQGRFWMTLRVDNVLAFIAEIRRLRRESEMLHQIVDDAIAMAAHRRTGLLGPEVVAHRKCPCGGDPVEHEGLSGIWIDCDYCHCGTNTEETLDAAWAAWDGA